MGKYPKILLTAVVIGSSMLVSCNFILPRQSEKQSDEKNMALQSEVEDLRAETEQLRKEVAENKLKKKAAEEAAREVPDKVIIRNANHAGVVLRTGPDDSTKLTGDNLPHFMTGYIFLCCGISGSYYKVLYDGDYYYIPMQYSSPYYGSEGTGGPMKWCTTNY